MNKILKVLIPSLIIVGFTLTLNFWYSFDEESEKYQTYDVVEIDGCEYVIIWVSRGRLSSHGTAHKGNCKNH